MGDPEGVGLWEWGRRACGAGEWPPDKGTPSAKAQRCEGSDLADAPPCMPVCSHGHGGPWESHLLVPSSPTRRWNPLSCLKTCSTGLPTTRPAASCSGLRAGSATRSRTSDCHSLPTSLHRGRSCPPLPACQGAESAEWAGQLEWPCDQTSPLHLLGLLSPSPIIDAGP